MPTLFEHSHPILDIWSLTLRCLNTTIEKGAISCHVIEAQAFTPAQIYPPKKVDPNQGETEYIVGEQNPFLYKEYDRDREAWPSIHRAFEF